MSGERERQRVYGYFLSAEVERIRNFRSRLVLDLSDRDGKPARWTVLIGDNGTGKTTLLQAIASLRPGYQEYEEPGGIGSFMNRRGTTLVGGRQTGR